MKKGSTIIVVIIAIILILALSIVGVHSGLVDAQEEVNKASADIGVQLERRADLIPNLVNTVKGYMSHETEIIDKITTARENMVKADNINDKLNADQELTKALNNLFVIVENYPELKSNTNFINLQDELAGTENRIAQSRKTYNEAVKNYNAKIKKFPSNIIASMFNFKEESYFEAKESSNEVPQVNFE